MRSMGRHLRCVQCVWLGADPHAEMQGNSRVWVLGPHVQMQGVQAGSHSLKGQQGHREHSIRAQKQGTRVCPSSLSGKEGRKKPHSTRLPLAYTTRQCICAKF
jgi:hypothetical protein